MKESRSALQRAMILGGTALAALPPLLVTEVLWQAPLVGGMYGLVVLASAPMAISRFLSLQLLSRSIWWGTTLYSGLGVGALAYHGALGSPGEVSFVMMFAAILVGSITALVSAGKTGLANISGVFAPKVARVTLMASIILALADTQTLGFYGLVSLQDGMYGEALKFFVAGAAMLASLFGLYRLKVWGLFATAGVNVVVAGLVVAGVLQLPSLLAGALVTTAFAQLLLPIPLIKRLLAQMDDSRENTNTSISTSREEEVVFSGFEQTTSVRESVTHRVHS